MQGYVDLLGCEWDAGRKQLRGVATVVGGEPYKIVIAANGFRPTSAAADQTISESIAHSRLGPGGPKASAAVRLVKDQPTLAELTLERPENGPVAWVVTFQEP